MEFFQALILGVVEGVTEFLPISSTGHLILTTDLLGLAETDFLKSFEICIQFGAILSVVVLYGRRFLVNWDILKRILVAFLPTAFLGFIFYKIVKKFLLGNALVVVWALFLGGILLILFEVFHKEKKDGWDELARIPYSKAFLIGIFQSLAIVPGVSRAAATILGGLLLGLKRKTIVEFSFLLAVPTMLAATTLDLLKSVNAFSLSQSGYLVLGFLVSFGVAILSIQFLLHFIKTYSFIGFGWYRILVGFLFWLMID